MLNKNHGPEGITGYTRPNKSYKTPWTGLNDDNNKSFHVLRLYADLRPYP